MAASPAEEIARRFIELYNDGTPQSYGSDRFLELFDDNVVAYELPTSWFAEGRRSDSLTDYRRGLEAGQMALRNRKITLHEVVADGDRAAMRYQWQAEVGIDGLAGFGPRGSLLRAEVAHFITVASEKITRSDEYLSVLPPAGDSAVAKSPHVSTTDPAGGKAAGLAAAEVGRQYFEVCNDGSDRCLDLVADDVDWHGMPAVGRPDGYTVNVKAIREAVRAGQNPLRNRRLTLHGIIADGDRAAMRYLWEATTGAGGQPQGTTDATLRAEVAGFVTVRHGKIVRFLEYAATLPNA